MTLKLNTAEGGTDGTATTTANSGGGSGDAFTAVSAVVSGAIAFRAANAYRGALCYALVQATSANACTFEWSDTASDQFAHRMYLRLLEYPSANCQGPLNIRGTAAAARLNMSTTGQLSITIVNGTTSTSGGFSTGTLALNTWYRIECVGSGFGSSSTAVACNVYLGDATGTPAFAVPSPALVATAEQISVIRVGRANAVGSNNWLVDDLAQSIGTSLELGPSPTGTAGADQTVEPGQPVTLTGGGAGTWAQTAGTTVQLYDGQGLTAPASTLSAWSALWDAVPLTGPGTGTGGWLGGDGCWSVVHPTGQSALFTFGDSPVSRVLPLALLGTSATSQGTATNRLIVTDAQAAQFAPGGKVQVFLTGGSTYRYGSTVYHTISSMNSAGGFTNLNLVVALSSAPAVGDVIKGVSGGTDTAFPNSSAVMWTKRRGLQLVTGLGTFIPNDAGQSTTWYWAGPMVVDSDGALYCFPSKQIHDTSPAGYSLLGRGIFRYAWENAWQVPSNPVKVTDMTSPILWGAAACADGSYNYIYGTYKPTSNDFSYNLYLARCPRGGLSRAPASWEFWTPTGWGSGTDLLTDPDQLAALIVYGADTFQGVENTVSAHNLGGSFKVTSKKGGTFGSAVTVWDASAVTGPYVPRTVGTSAYGSPTSADQSYLTNGHYDLPALGTGNYLVSVSRNRNTLTTADYLAGSAFYRPAWFEAALNGGTYTAAAAGVSSTVQFIAPATSLTQQVLTFTFGATTVNVTVLAPTERVIRDGVEVPVITRTAI